LSPPPGRIRWAALFLRPLAVILYLILPYLVFELAWWWQPAISEMFRNLMPILKPTRQQNGWDQLHQE